VEYARNGARLVVEGSWVVLANKWTPQSFLVDDIAAVDSQGALITNEETKMTSVQGLFACGEVTKKTSFTFARSIADGLETSTAVIAYLLENGWMPEKKPTPPEGAVQPKPPAPPENPPGEKKVVPLA
jgi:thioredoxin reductase